MNRSREAKIVKKLGKVFSRGVSLQLLAEQSVDIRSSHAELVNKLYTCAYELWILAGSYKGITEYRPMHKKTQSG